MQHYDTTAAFCIASYSHGQLCVRSAASSRYDSVELPHSLYVCKRQALWRSHTMKRKFFTVAQVVVLVFVATLAGATAGRVIPMLPGMSSSGAVNAASLEVK